MASLTAAGSGAMPVDSQLAVRQSAFTECRSKAVNAEAATTNKKMAINLRAYFHIRNALTPVKICNRSSPLTFSQRPSEHQLQ